MSAARIPITEVPDAPFSRGSGSLWCCLGAQPCSAEEFEHRQSPSPAGTPRRPAPPSTLNRCQDAPGAAGPDTAPHNQDPLAEGLPHVPGEGQLQPVSRRHSAPAVTEPGRSQPVLPDGPRVPRARSRGRQRAHTTGRGRGRAEPRSWAPIGGWAGGGA